MVKKDKKIKLVEELYAKLREDVFYKYSVLNYNKIETYEKELVNLHEYLPNIISGYVVMDYKILNELGVWEDIVKQIGKARHYSREDDIVEFIDWIDKHDEFEDLIKRNEVKKLYDEIDKLENEKLNTIKILT